MVHIKKKTKKKPWPLSHTFLKRILRGKNNNNKRGFLKKKVIIIKDFWTIFCLVKLGLTDMQWLSGKESTCQCRRHVLDPWVGKIPWRRKCNPLQYSCLENPMVRGACMATVLGVTNGGTQLSRSMCYRLYSTENCEFLISFQEKHSSWRPKWK